jgi:hypothetical protein
MLVPTDRKMRTQNGICVTARFLKQFFESMGHWGTERYFRILLVCYKFFTNEGFV